MDIGSMLSMLSPDEVPRHHVIIDTTFIHGVPIDTIALTRVAARVGTRPVTIAVDNF
jgi:hypothetical protein